MLAAPALLVAVAPFVYGIVLTSRSHVGLGVTMLVLSVLVPIVGVGVIEAALFKPYRIPSPAMAPTLQVGDRILVKRVGGTGRGDVVVFHPPAGADTHECGVPGSPADGHPCAKPSADESPNNFVKRVIALPGERVKVLNNRAYVNGKPLDEPYVDKSTTCDELCNLPKEITVPPGHFFVMGDNRGESDDSRDWGPVPRSWIIGDVVVRYIPLSRLKFF